MPSCVLFPFKVFSLLDGWFLRGGSLESFNYEALESWRRVTRQARFEKEKILGFTWQKFWKLAGISHALAGPTRAHVL